MPKTTKLIVKKVEGGYQVHQLGAEGKEPTAANDKVYFHPTSAYAAMGRLVHKENTQGFSSDPAKAPAKEPAAK